LLTGRILIVAFEGWNDATEAATGALKALSEQISGQILEAVDPEDYYDFQFSRPIAEYDDEGQRILTGPPQSYCKQVQKRQKRNLDCRKSFCYLEPSHQGAG